MHHSTLKNKGGIKKIKGTKTAKRTNSQTKRLQQFGVRFSFWTFTWRSRFAEGSLPQKAVLSPQSKIVEEDQHWLPLHQTVRREREEGSWRLQREAQDRKRQTSKSWAVQLTLKPERKKWKEGWETSVNWFLKQSKKTCWNKGETEESFKILVWQMEA